MTEAEPTPWELMRKLESIDRKMDNVVTKDMFNAESRRVDEKLADMTKDLADERAARERGLAEEKGARIAAIVAEQGEREKARAAQERRSDRLQRTIQWVAASIIVPVAIFLIEHFGGGSL